MEEIPAKRILYRKKDNTWFGSDYNFNLYQGCFHGCIYCDSRSLCYGIDRFGQVRVKQNAIPKLREELKSCKKTGIAATGAMSDPYNPLEQQCAYTRSALELLEQFGFGAAIATKSDFILRDRDLLCAIAKNAPCIVKITVTTADDDLASWIEPHAPMPSKRLKTIDSLSSAGIFTGILMMPVLPFLEDSPTEIRRLVRQSADCGAKFIYPYFGVTLRDRQREYFLQKVREHSPTIWKRYLEFGDQYQCLSPHAKQLWQVFCEECRSNNILYRMKDIIAESQKPYRTEQLSLF